VIAEAATAGWTAAASRTSSPSLSVQPRRVSSRPRLAESARARRPRSGTARGWQGAPALGQVSSGNVMASRLRPAAAGAAEAGQPERDLAEHGSDLVGAVILDLARSSAGATYRPPWSRLWTVTIACWTRATSCFPCARVKPRSAISPRSPGRSIASTSTLRLDPSTPVSTRRKTHPILDPQPAKNSAGHTLPNTAPPIF
jgi:hypothetical protein